MSVFHLIRALSGAPRDGEKMYEERVEIVGAAPTREAAEALLEQFPDAEIREADPEKHVPDPLWSKKPAAPRIL